jgi:hypothetical protein
VISRPQIWAQNACSCPCWVGQRGARPDDCRLCQGCRCGWYCAWLGPGAGPDNAAERGVHGRWGKAHSCLARAPVLVAWHKRGLRGWGWSRQRRHPSLPLCRGSLALPTCDGTYEGIWGCKAFGLLSLPARSSRSPSACWCRLVLLFGQVPVTITPLCPNPSPVTFAALPNGAWVVDGTQAVTSPEKVGRGRLVRGT